MALFGLILARNEFNPLSGKTINHEKIHAAQAKDCGFWIFYYAVYLFQWASVGFKYKKIPFEIEAYKHESEIDYLKKRKKYGWKEYK